MTNDIYIYKVSEVARILGVNNGSVYSLIHKGLLGAIKFGTYKVPKFEVDNFLHKYSRCDLTDLNNIQTIN